LSAMWVGHSLAKRQWRSGRLGVVKPHLKKATARRSRKVRRQRRSAWQCYVHLSARGRRADFKSLHQSFAQLSASRLAELQEKARAACFHPGGKQGVRKNPFKDPLRAAVDAATRRRRVAHWLRRRQGLTDAQRLEAVLSEAFAKDPSAEQAVQAAGAEARFEQSRALEQNRARSASLRAFQQSEAGRGAVSTLASTGALQPGSEGQFAPFPFPDAVAFDFAPDTAAVAEGVLLACRQPGVFENLAGALSLDWVRRTQTICQSGLEPIPDKPKGDRQADRCRIAGQCLCSDEGRLLLRFSNKFLYSMKPHFKLHTPGRKLLQDGLIVVALDLAPVPAGGRAAARALPLPNFLLPGGSGRLWLHIGMHYFKPYRPTFQILQPSAAEPSVPGSIALKAQGGFETMFSVFADIDHKSLCSMAFFRVWESDQPLGQFVPSELTVLPYSDPELFWYGPFRAPRTRRRPPADEIGEGSPAEAMLALGDAAPEPRGESDAEDVAGSSDEPSDEESDRDSSDLNEVLAALLESMVDEPEARRAPTPAEGELGPLSGVAGEEPPHTAQPEAHEPCLPPVGGSMAGSSNDPMPGGIVAQPVPVQPSSAVEAPPPPPQPFEARRPYSRGLNPTRFRQGSITFYPDKNDPEKGRFQAVCGHPELHGKSCRLTRTSAPSVRVGGNQAQGRPLGLLAAWLVVGELAADRAAHDASVPFLSADERLAAREELLSQPNGAELAAHERPMRLGEPLEPDGLP
jgi:hypothetical protein